MSCYPGPGQARVFGIEAGHAQLGEVNVVSARVSMSDGVVCTVLRARRLLSVSLVQESVASGGSGARFANCRVPVHRRG
ncbi:MAG: hypothetical protein OXG37_09400 [Actinomycetia bacterium]|nr:hypothetical protein [Actinomycetes bacterium]